MPYLWIASVVLPPPLPALLTILLVAGYLFQGLLLLRLLRIDPAKPYHLAAAFLTVTAVWSAAIQWAYLVGNVPLVAARVAAWGLAGLGMIGLKYSYRGLKGILRPCVVGRTKALPYLLPIVAAIALALSALGPATDADSLHYHLAVPLDWLANGKVTDRPDWYTSRLVGLGESQILLGLAAGTDGFSAGLQAAGMLLALLIVAEAASNTQNRALAALLVCACPVWGFLVPNQKPQALPVVASLVAAAWLLEQQDSRSSRILPLLFASLGFALACKYTFLLTAGPMALALALTAWRRRGMRLHAAAGCLLAALIVAPHLARSLATVGDPVWPFLSSMRPETPAAVKSFAAAVRGSGIAKTIENALALPLLLAFPSGLGFFQMVLGAGLFSFLALAPLREPRVRLVVAIAVIAAGAELSLSSWSARWLLEPYLWMAMVIVRQEWNWRKTVLGVALQVQALACAAIFTTFAVAMIVGAATRGGRDVILRRMAWGFSEAAWMDRVLPRDAVILTNARALALLPRRFVVADAAAFETSIERRVVAMRRLVATTRPTHAVHVVDAHGDVLDGPNPCLGSRFAGPITFQRATRNPFNLGRPESLAIFSLSPCSGGAKQPPTGSSPG